MIKPFQKSHNTAFRLFTVLLYGLESNLPYLEYLGTAGRYRRLRLRPAPCSYSMRMTVHRMKEHLTWLQDIGLIGELNIAPGLIELTVKLPIDPEDRTDD